MDEGKESQINGFDHQVFSNIIRENFPKLRKYIHSKIQEVQTTNREDKEGNSSQHIIVKILVMLNEGVLKTAREKSEI